jgi:hypothetical protein
VGGTGLNFPAANHAVITANLWELNQQQQAFAQVHRLGHNWAPDIWLLYTGAGGYDNHAINLHQLSGVAQIRVRHCKMSRPIIPTSMIYHILEACENHTQRLTENGDKLQFDQPLILECETLHQGIPL